MNLMTEMFGSQNVRWCTELDTDIIVITVDTSKAVLNARTMVRNRLLSFTITTCLYCYSMYQSHLVFVIAQKAAQKLVTKEVPLHNLICRIPMAGSQLSGITIKCQSIPRYTRINHWFTYTNPKIAWNISGLPIRDKIFQ